jgi:hypothetical protein
MGGQLSWLFLFVHSFYGIQVPFFNHHSSSRVLFIILSFMGTHQGNPFVGPFLCLLIFALCVVFKGFSFYVSSFP